MPKKIEIPRKSKNYETRPNPSPPSSQPSSKKKPSSEQEDYYTDSSERSSNDTSEHADSCEERHHSHKEDTRPHKENSDKSSRDKSDKSGKVIHINDEDEYNNILKTSSESQLIIVKFSAKWCGPCKTIAPKYDALSKHFTKCLFLYIDIDELSDASTVQDVSAVPTFKLFKNGTLVSRFSGADIPKLENLIEKNK